MWGAYCRIALRGACMKSKTVIFVSVVFGFILVIFAGSILLNRPYEYQGSIIEPPIKAGKIELIQQNGQIYRLSDKNEKLALIFFGYTNCPDICPSTLTEYQNIYQGLKGKADQVKFIFITVDPERDTPQRLQDYIGFFNPNFIGLTSDRQTLEQVWKAYGVYQQKQDEGSAAGYLVDHSTRMYLVDSLGNLVITYPFGFGSEKITEDIVHMLNQGGHP